LRDAQVVSPTAFPALGEKRACNFDEEEEEEKELSPK
jgi:hypothetical protein